MRRIGLVFEGGGGKGAYQIGAWRAIRELGIEKHICMVSGTSVGALNAALFYQGNLGLAEEIWNSISCDDILYEKQNDNYLNGDSFFSQKKLGDIISNAIRGCSSNQHCKKCYVTCKYRDQNRLEYFEWSKYYDIELKKKILLASSAIPIVFESVEIDGEFYIDGGVNGDNTPVAPLLQENLDTIIVIHLENRSIGKTNFDGDIIEVFPSIDLGGFIGGTLDFDSLSINKRMEIGYIDGLKMTRALGDSLLNVSMKSSERNIRATVGNSNQEKTIHMLNYCEGETEMEDFTFTNDDARKMYEEKYQLLKSIANEKVDDTRYLWDATVRKYATKMETVKRVLRSEGISEQVTSKMFKDIDRFLERCVDAEFHIALVGAIKAGKSTLINAMLGHEYASTKVTPETAALTKFKKGVNNYVKVIFYSNCEWDTLWKSANEARATVFLEEYAKLGAENEKIKWLDQNEKVVICESQEELVKEIQKWTSSKSVCHYFVKEVEVGLKEFELPEGVVLVDTPGLDDVVEYRSNITRDYIDRANAVLVCVKSDALTGQEWATICSVFSNARYNPEKVYVIATQVDTLNRPRENWIEQKGEWTKYLKGKSAYASKELAERNLIPVSAYLYTLLKENEFLTEKDDKYWDLDSIIRKFRIKDINEHYRDMIAFTNIELLKRKIQNEIISNYKKLLIEDISGAYDLCKESINESMARVKLAQSEIIEASKGDLNDIYKKQQEYFQKYEEAERDKKELDTMLKRLRTSVTQRASELEKEIKNLNR